MKPLFILAPLLFNYFLLFGQDNNIKVIRHLDLVNTNLKEHFIKEIKLKGVSTALQSYAKIKKQLIDSAKQCNGNFVHVKQYEPSSVEIPGKKIFNIRVQHMVIADLYNFSEQQLNDKLYKSKKNKYAAYRDAVQRKYETSVVFGIGGESKLAFFLPRLHLNRVNEMKYMNYYYGIGIGFHPTLIGARGSVHVQTGIEYKRMDFETSLSHMRVSGWSLDSSSGGPWQQSLLNFKVGYMMYNNGLKFRLITSKVLQEKNPNAPEKFFYLDFAKYGNYILGLEVAIAI